MTLTAVKKKKVPRQPQRSACSVRVSALSVRVCAHPRAPALIGTYAQGRNRRRNASSSARGKRFFSAQRMWEASFECTLHKCGCSQPPLDARTTNKQVAPQPRVYSLGGANKACGGERQKHGCLARSSDQTRIRDEAISSRRPRSTARGEEDERGRRSLMFRRRQCQHAAADSVH